MHINIFSRSYKMLNSKSVCWGGRECFLTTKGPRILQRKGIPSYRLTKMGILVTSALEELEIKKERNLLKMI
jgi:hypothetical protein